MKENSSVLPNSNNGLNSMEVSNDKVILTGFSNLGATVIFQFLTNGFEIANFKNQKELKKFNVVMVELKEMEDGTRYTDNQELVSILTSSNVTFAVFMDCDGTYLPFTLTDYKDVVFQEVE